VRPFSLLRYFALASLGVIVVLALVIAGVFSANLERNLTEEAGQYAQDLSRSINRELYQQFLGPLAKAGESFDPTRPEQLAAVDAIVAARTEGFRILDVILFDTKGTVIYSTHAPDIGFRSIDNPGIAAALQGESPSELESSELERSTAGPGTPLVETYTPFYDLSAEGSQPTIRGVLEVYQDGRPIANKIAAGRRQIVLATAALMALLFGSLFAIVHRGDQRIRQLTRELEDSNRVLEERVVERTHEIETGRTRLQALFDGIADGISVIDADFRVSASNTGIERLFGERPAGERCFERYAGRSEPCEHCPAQLTIASGRRAERRYRWKTSAGEREVEVTTFPFQRATGDAAVIELVRDVSERVALEHQIVQSESLANLGQLAAGVAHEIRNPIGMIMSAAQLLGRAGLAERDRELIDVLLHESARVEATVSEFVRFATPPPPSRAATDVGPLLERVAAVLRPEAEKRGARLEVRAAAGLPRIVVDPEMLFRALTNLALNALQVQERDGWVELRAAPQNAGVEICVSDRGPGIPEEDRERVFQPFFSRRAGGTGLGLSIVQRIVSANGGRIQVSSRPQGTSFALQFGEVAP
jgi:signal transduction histidine kinase